jgi:hypothetical protein
MSTPPKPRTTKVAKVSNRGSKPGERRGGRQKGTLNKATRTVKEAAQEYTDEALKTLVAVMNDEAAPPAARVSAANGVLDRGHGKPGIYVDHTSSDGSMAVPMGLGYFYGEEGDEGGEHP